MMRLVSYEIPQNVPYIERKISPDVGRRRRDATALLTAEREQVEDAATASLQSRHQLPTPNAPPVDTAGDGDPLRLAPGPDPHAPGIVQVACDHPDLPTRRPWNGRGP